MTKKIGGWRLAIGDWRFLVTLARLLRVVLAVLFLVRAPFLGAQTNALPRGPMVITADRGDFDMNSRTAIYQGDVHVDDPQMKLQCAWMLATLPPTGGHINHIVCKTNVVIDYTDEKGQTNHITSDQGVYNYSVQGSVTNETITFTGNPRMENAQSIITGDPIVWDRATGGVHITGEKIIFKEGLGGLPGGSAAGLTNAGNAEITDHAGAAGMTNH